MASKFSEFLTGNKIDPRRVSSASSFVEKLRPEDRALRLKRRNSKKAEAPAGDAAAQPPTKPRSGRPVTSQLLSKALDGKPLTGPGKTRLLRAVNHVLTQKKKDAVDLRALF